MIIGDKHFQVVGFQLVFSISCHSTNQPSFSQAGQG